MPCRHDCPSRRHLHTSLIASKPYMVEHECTPADGGRKRKAARKRKSMEERTERAAAVKKKKAEKNALVDSEPRSSRNGHNMVTPHRAQATLNHRNSVHAPPSLHIMRLPVAHRYSRTRRFSHPPQATVVLLPPINHRECRMALRPPCMANSLMTWARMAVDELTGTLKHAAHHLGQPSLSSP